MKLKKINGFKASRSGPAISHMFFADVSLIFYKANEQECRNLLEVLSIYGRASGQRVNFQKSVITFNKGTCVGIRDAIIQ